ncbi:MAG: DNA-3-methyladenine glycosylase [bacterium]|nr:DNA-3-methyladenine glycosylase [bacterium]
MQKLPRTFFEQKTLTIARELLGKTLVRKVGRKIIREKITEVEAYVGPHDLACHSSKGRTMRTEVMHKSAGTIYVYLIYGMYYMLNIVTEKEDFPAAVLIRATENFKGPGVLTRELKIDKNLNGKMLGKSSGLWIELDLKTENSKLKITRGPRVGVSYAGPIWSKKPYRFVLKS